MPTAPPSSQNGWDNGGGGLEPQPSVEIWDDDDWDDDDDDRSSNSGTSIPCTNNQPVSVAY